MAIPFTPDPTPHQAHDTYRVDTCLALCEQHGVQDATAYLKVY